VVPVLRKPYRLAGDSKNCSILLAESER